MHIAIDVAEVPPGRRGTRGRRLPYREGRGRCGDRGCPVAGVAREVRVTGRARTSRGCGRRLPERVLLCHDRVVAASRTVAKAVLSRCKPAYRVAMACAAPANKGARTRAAVRVLRHEVLTRALGRPIVVPIGTHSRIIARHGETSSPHAVWSNPPNDQMRVWRNHLRPGDLFVDGGANIGIYTVFALDLGAEVIAVEPTANAERVREHLRLNGCTATVVQQALSDATGTLRITDDLDSFNHLVLDGSHGVEVPTTTLDALLGERTAAGLKLDVEGVERLVLQGASRALAERRIRLMQLEWTPNAPVNMLGETREPVAELLRQHGYRLYRHDRGGHLQEIDGPVPPELHDVFAAAPDARLDPRLFDGFCSDHR